MRFCPWGKISAFANTNSGWRHTNTKYVWLSMLAPGLDAPLLLLVVRGAGKCAVDMYRYIYLRAGGKGESSPMLAGASASWGKWKSCSRGKEDEDQSMCAYMARGAHSGRGESWDRARGGGRRNA